MINVTSTFVRADIKTGKCYNSHITIDGCRTQIICEIKALIDSFLALDNPELENIYLSIATEIAEAHLKDLERTLEDLKND